MIKETAGNFNKVTMFAFSKIVVFRVMRKCSTMGDARTNVEWYEFKKFAAIVSEKRFDFKPIPYRDGIREIVKKDYHHMIKK